MAFIEKVKLGQNGQSSFASPDDEQTAKKFPALWEFLTADIYPGGQARQRSTLTVFVDGADFKLCLNDRDNSRSLWVTSGTLAGALGLLEKALVAGVAPWRVDRRPEQQQRGRRR